VTRQLSNQTQQQTSTTSPLSSGILQRKCVSCGQLSRPASLSPLQRRSTNQDEPSEVSPILQEVLRSPGQPLDAVTHAFRESRFAQDFSSVRVHTEAKAAEVGRIEPSAQYRRHKSGVQPKLTIGQLGDKYEQEADTVAAKVMSMAAPANQQSVQREMAPEEEKEKLQTKPRAGFTIQREMALEQEKEEPVQMKRSPDRNSQSSSNIESQLSATKGGGSPLPNEVRSFMEARFGADFSQVRVHTGGEAVQMNRELSAQAFTHGSDVYFGEGKSPGNNELTAHELTHVVQQGGAQPTARTKPQAINNNTASLVLPSLLESGQGVTFINSNYLVQRAAGPGVGAAVGTALSALGILQSQVNATQGELQYTTDFVSYPAGTEMVPEASISIKNPAAYFYSGGFVPNSTYFVLAGEFGQDKSGKPVMANLRMVLSVTTTYEYSKLTFFTKVLPSAYGTADDPKIRIECSGRFNPVGLGDCGYYAVLEVGKDAVVKCIDGDITSGKGKLTKSDTTGFALFV